VRLDPSSIGNLSLFFDIRFDEVVELLQHQRMRKDCQLREFFLDFRCIRNALNRWASRARIGEGTLAGARKPNHVLYSYPRMASSLTLGAFTGAFSPSRDVTANANSLPSWTCPSTNAKGTNDA
jgi:hypothetical protein